MTATFSGVAITPIGAQAGPGSAGTTRGSERRVAVATATSRSAIRDDAAPSITPAVIGADMVIAAPRLGSADVDMGASGTG